MKKGIPQTRLRTFVLLSAATAAVLTKIETRRALALPASEAKQSQLELPERGGRTPLPVREPKGEGEDGRVGPPRSSQHPQNERRPKGQAGDECGGPNGGDHAATSSRGHKSGRRSDFETTPSVARSIATAHSAGHLFSCSALLTAACDTPHTSATAICEPMISIACLSFC